MGTPVAKRILVADDDETIARVWEEGFELEGYDVRKATQSLRFYDAVLAYQPDIIVLDLLMPYLEGQDELEAAPDAPHRQTHTRHRRDGVS